MSGKGIIKISFASPFVNFKILKLSFKLSALSFKLSFNLYSHAVIKAYSIFKSSFLT